MNSGEVGGKWQYKIPTINNMNSKKGFSLALFVLLSVCQHPVRAQDIAEGKWELLGTHVIDYTLDNDVVKLDTTVHVYTMLKIQVLEGSLSIHKIVVDYVNGDSRIIRLPKTYTKGNDSKMIDVSLKKNKHVIEKVSFWFNPKKAAAQKSVVEVWGKK